MFLGPQHLPQPSPDRGEQQQIPPEYPGTAATIKAMHQLVALAVQDRPVVELAQGIVGGLPRRDYQAEAEAILRWCQVNLRWVRDPYHPTGLERLQYPGDLLFQNPARSGDCDDLAMAFSALAAAIGFPWAFRTVGKDPLFPKRFGHVLSLVWFDQPQIWVPADPSFENALGWEPPLNDPRVSPLVAAPGTAATREDWFP